MSVFSLVILTLVGIFAGAFGSMLGLGGGIILVPALFYLPSLISGVPPITPQLAVGTSLMLIIITSLSSTLSYSKKKLIDVSSALLFFVGSAPGSILGAWLSTRFDSKSFTLYYGLFMLLMLVILTYRKRLSPRNMNWKITKTYVDVSGQTYTYGYSRSLAIIIAFVVGTMSSVFGIGGGALLVPFMLVLFRFPPHMAAATSMLVILLSSIVGSVTHVALGHIIWSAVLAIAPGAWIGGKLGSTLAGKLPGNRIELILRLVLLFLAIRMLWHGLVA